MNIVSEILDRLIEGQVFFPDPFLLQTPADAGLEYQDVWIDTSDGLRLHGWFVPATPSVGLILFCHGNAGNVSHRLVNIRLLIENGLSVFIFDYRGYGRSEGLITETGFYLDAEAAYAVARGMADRERAKLIIFGRSLGGIAAVHLAATRSCEGLILESTFTNLAALFNNHLTMPVPESFMKDRFNAVNKIGEIKVNKIFFHGDHDNIVPIRFGRELFEAALDPKEFVTLEGAGHNDTYVVGGVEYFAKWKSFMAGLPYESR
jgi:uncharacterized protein